MKVQKMRQTIRFNPKKQVSRLAVEIGWLGRDSAEVYQMRNCSPGLTDKSHHRCYRRVKQDRRLLAVI
ncbi:hypothetical protein [Faecalicatena contorta]|uniref:hypothetical protein n=1 Tax=Faecalicatena contorta TaxID=39482 RepID=UPI00129D713C|nr:hypothetical protein [Faecalicatena contorta]